MLSNFWAKEHLQQEKCHRNRVSLGSVSENVFAQGGYSAQDTVVHVANLRHLPRHYEFLGHAKCPLGIHRLWYCVSLICRLDAGAVDGFREKCLEPFMEQLRR